MTTKKTKPTAPSLAELEAALRERDAAFIETQRRGVNDEPSRQRMREAEARVEALLHPSALLN